MGLGEPECLQVAVSSLCWEKVSSLGYLVFFRSSSVMAVDDPWVECFSYLQIKLY